MVDPNLNDDVQNQQAPIAIPINSEKGIFSQENNTVDETTDIESIRVYETLKKTERPLSDTQGSPNDVQDDSSSIGTHVVDLRRKPATPAPKPIRAILSNADNATKFAALTEQDFITSIKAKDGN